MKKSNPKGLGITAAAYAFINGFCLSLFMQSSLDSLSAKQLQPITLITGSLLPISLIGGYFAGKKAAEKLGYTGIKFSHYFVNQLALSIIAAAFQYEQSRFNFSNL